MAGGGEGDGEKSAFRCLDAARYVAAALVVVLIAAVIVNAIRVVLRSDEITLLVVGNSVFVTPARAPPLLNYKFTLRAVNPGGRVRLYYYNITTYVFRNDTMATTPTPLYDSDTSFNPDNITVPPVGYVDSIVVPDEDGGLANDSGVIDPTFFNDLYAQGQGGRVPGVTMRVDGQLVSEIRSGYNTSAQNMTFYCRDLVFGPEDKVAMDSQEKTCTTS